jgi:hypothetical protein
MAEDVIQRDRPKGAEGQSRVRRRPRNSHPALATALRVVAVTAICGTLGVWPLAHEDRRTGLVATLPPGGIAWNFAYWTPFAGSAATYLRADTRSGFMTLTES